MPNPVFFALVAILAAGLIALALVYPQGLGARSPAPFGGPTAAELYGPEGARAAKAAELKGGL